MNMKLHILTALREEYDHWVDLLGGLNEDQILTPLLPSDWTIQDNMAHLWAWQQRSVARVEAALLDRAPVFPLWPAHLNPEAEDITDQINAWIYETNREKSWPTVYQDWQKGFQRFLEVSDEISERDLLDGDRYPWLSGSPLALVLLSSYDHHQEHFEKLIEWMQEHGKADDVG